MRYLILALTLFVCSSVVNGALSDDRTVPALPMIGTPPDQSVKNWSRFFALGEINAPLPAVWVSPQAFPLSGYQRLIVLPRRQYARFLAYVHSTSCSASLGSIIKQKDWRAILITEYSRGRSRDCILSHEKACMLLSKISAGPELDKMRESEPLQLLSRVIKCAGTVKPRR